MEQLGINEPNYFKYQWAGPDSAYPPLIVIVHPAPASQPSIHTAPHQ